MCMLVVGIHRHYAVVNGRNYILHDCRKGCLYNTDIKWVWLESESHFEDAVHHMEEFDNNFWKVWNTQ